VAESLQKCLTHHPEIDARCSKGIVFLYTTDDNIDFDRHAGYFYGDAVRSERVFL
jgi:hypothetical protein